MGRLDGAEEWCFSSRIGQCVVFRCFASILERLVRINLVGKAPNRRLGGKWYWVDRFEVTSSRSIRGSWIKIDSKQRGAHGFETFLHYKATSSRTIWIRNTWSRTPSIRPSLFCADGFECLSPLRSLLLWFAPLSELRPTSSLYYDERNEI